MDKNKAKYFIDIGLLVSFLIALVTGIVKFRKFLGIFGISLNYAEMPMSVISAWHDWSGLAIGILVLAHLILNFDWIIAMTKDFLGIKNDRKI